MLDVEWQVVGHPRERVFAVLGVCQWCSAIVHHSTVYSLWCGFVYCLCLSDIIMVLHGGWGGGGVGASYCAGCVCFLTAHPRHRYEALPPDKQSRILLPG